MSYPPQRFTHIVPINITFNTATIQWQNQPSALTEFLGAISRRTKIDLSNLTQARLITRVDVAGATGAKLAVQYSTDESSWNYLDDSSGPFAIIDTTGLKISSFVNISTLALTDVFLRIVGTGGNGVADPNFSNIISQFI